MKLRSTSTRDSVPYENAGFTLIEMLVVIAIITAIASFGVVAGIDSYNRYLFRGNLEQAAALLQKARSSAMNNIGENSHGVYFGNLGTFVLFRGASYLSRNPSFDLLVEKSKNVTVSGPPETVFAPLAGTTAGGTITFNDGVRNAAITINHEGGINW